MVDKELTATSFDLNEDMLNILSQEFDVQKVVDRFAGEAAKGKGNIDAVAESIFSQYGREWMTRTIQLGEEYPDRTYEVIKAAAQRTGVIAFPHIPQRLIEIAYLATQPILKLPTVENSPARLVYRLDSCAVFDALKDKCGQETASLLPCKYACLTACEQLFKKLGMEVELKMEAAMPKEGYCQFAASKIGKR